MLEKIFINEKKQIENVIKNISSENCIAQYFKYLNFNFNDEKYEDSLEKDFNYKLNKRKRDFVAKIVEKHLREIPQEEVIKIACTFKMEYEYNFENATDNNEEIDFVKEHITDEEFFPLLIEEMKSTLDELFEEREKLLKEKEREKVEIQIKNLKSTIERNKKDLEYYETKIKKLDKEKEQ